MKSLLRGLKTWRTVLRLASVGVLCLGTMPLISAQQNQSPGEALRVLPVRGNIHMIAGAGGNIAVQIGPDGVVLVDTGTGDAADAVIAAIRKLTPQPIRYIISTGPDADHLGGNEKVAKAGRSFFRGMASNAGGASIIGTETLLLRISAPTGSVAPFPVAVWPTDTFTQRQRSFYLNHEGIQVLYEPAAHTDSDAMVMFRRSDVIVTGDIFDITRFPVIALDKGGSIQGEINALNHLLELTIPSIPLPYLEDGGTQVIPGHGRICEEAEVVEYRDMVTIIRDRVQDMIKNGMTLDQIQAANPTIGYRRRYGSDSGPWTTQMFVEAVYKSLIAQTGSARSVSVTR